MPVTRVRMNSLKLHNTEGGHFANPYILLKSKVSIAPFGVDCQRSRGFFYGRLKKINGAT